MHPRDIEVMHIVCKMVSIAEDPAPWAHRKMKSQTTLILIAARMHPRLHHALADLVAVQKLRQMANRVIHSPSSRDLPCQCSLNGIVNVQLVDRLVNGPALRLNASQIPNHILAQNFIDAAVAQRSPDLS